MNTKQLLLTVVLAAYTLIGFGQKVVKYVDENGKYGFKNSNEEVVISPKYDYANYFSNGLSKVFIGEMEFGKHPKKGKYGFVNTLGIEVTACDYDYIGYFDNGIARVFIGKTDKYNYPEKGKYGCVNSLGDIVIPCIYDDANYYEDGLIGVKKEGKWGYLDSNGIERIPFIYDDAYSFSEGLAAVEKNNKYGYIDTTGLIIIDFTFDIAFSFHNGYAVISREGKSALIDKKGKEYLYGKYDDISNLDNAFLVAIYKADSINFKYGIIDNKLKQTTQIKFDFVFENDILKTFIGETDSIGWPSKGKYGIINQNGKEIISCKYDGIISDFIDIDYDFCIVENNNKYGLVNYKNGDEATECKYDNINNNYYSSFCTIENNEKYGIIDLKNGNIIAPCIYDEPADIEYLNDYGYSLIKINNKYGVVDQKANEVIPANFDNEIDIDQLYEHGYVVVSKNNKYGIYDNKGKETIPIVFEYIYEIDSYEGVFNATVSGHWLNISLYSGKYDIADILINSNSYKNALAVINSISTKGLFSKRKKALKNYLYAEAYYGLNQYQLAIDHAKAAIKYSKSFNSSAYYIISKCYEANNEYSESLKYAELLLNEYNDNPKDAVYDLWEIYDLFGSIYCEMGHYQLSISYLNKAFNIILDESEITEEDNYSAMTEIMNSMGYTYSSMSDYRQAMYYFQRAIVYLKQDNYGNQNLVPIIYYSIATVYQRQGEITKALENYNKALIFYSNLKNKEGLDGIYVWLGKLYSDQNNLEMALKYHQESIHIRQELNDSGSIAESYLHLGGIYADLATRNNDYNPKLQDEDLIEANEYYQKSYKIASLINDEDRAANALFLIGRLFFHQNELDSAKKYLYLSLNKYTKLNSNRGVLNSQIAMGELYLRSNDKAKLFEYSKHAQLNAIEVGVPIEMKKAQLLSFYSEFIQGNEAASDTIVKDINSFNTKSIISNFAVLSELDQEKFFQTISPDIMNFISYALFRKAKNPKIAEDVYNNTLITKGLLLKSSTAMRQAILSSKDSALISNYYKWISIEKLIYKKQNKGENTKLIESQSNELEKELVRSSQVFSDLNNIQNVNWKDIQENLAPNEAAIEFIHFKLKDYNYRQISDLDKFSDTTLYCALIIKPNSQYPEMIPLFQEKQLEEIIGKFGGNNYNYINGIYGGKNVKMIHGSSLYNLIWKPMEESLKDVKTIYLSPTGLLHKISFPAIAKEQNVYLCDIYDIEVKSSTGKIVDGGGGGVKTHGRASQSHASQGHAHQRATLFGGINYNTEYTSYQAWSFLEGTKSETQQIDTILRNSNINVKYFTNTSATEKEFKYLASNSDIIHIATHGFFYPNPKDIMAEEDEQIIESSDIIFRGGNSGSGVNNFVNNPNPLMRSGLVFAGANDVWTDEIETNDEDGVLTAQEVSHIDMRKTNLVVMSACETGLGDIKGSEGVYGLQRAFKMAGVDYMIMSLWQVPDKETEEFMTIFYKKLIKQNNLPADEAGIKQAFNETQKEMRMKYDPYFWAAFVLIE